MLKELRLRLIEKLAGKDIAVTKRMDSKVYDWADTVRLSTVRDKIYIETPWGNMLINTDKLTITAEYFPGKFQLIEKEVK